MMQTASLAKPPGLTFSGVGASRRQPDTRNTRTGSGDVFISSRPVFGHGESHGKDGEKENRLRRWIHGGIVVAEAGLLTGLMIVAPGTVEELGHMIEHHLAEDSPLTKFVGPAAIGSVLAVTHQAIHVALEAGFYKWGKNRANREMKQEHSSFENLHGYVRELQEQRGTDYACEEAGDSAFIVRKTPDAPEDESDAKEPA